MTRRVALVDTSVLCCYLAVPGKDTAGAAADPWDQSRANAIVEGQVSQGATLVLPLATVVETGNHIAQASSLRYEKARELMALLRYANTSASPWAAFSEQAGLWGTDQVDELVETWPALAAQRVSLGDATIRYIADYYAQAGFEVVILSADAELAAYVPPVPVNRPRRRD